MKRAIAPCLPLVALTALAVVAACDSDEPGSDSSSSETTMSSPGTTSATAESSGDEDSGPDVTTGSTGGETTDTGIGSTGDGGSSTTGGSSTGEASTGGSSSGEDSGSTGGPPPPSGDWVDCFAGEDCNSPDATCTMIPQSTGYTCTFAPDMAAGCVDVSDCPAPPATGNAPVACGNVDFDQPEPECYLDCSAGQTCPDGQECFGTYGCGYPSTTQAPPYEACDGETALCVQDHVCLVDGSPATAGSCIGFACNSVADCAPGPAGATVVCADLNPVLLGNECYLGCTVDADCPAGGTCLIGQACVFPVP